MRPLAPLPVVLGIVTIAIALPIGCAFAQSGGPCAPHEQVAKLLAQNHHELRQAIGLTGNGQLLEIFVSPAGTWTAVISTPAGQSCITAAGEGWQLAAVKPDEGL